MHTVQERPPLTFFQTVTLLPPDAVIGCISIVCGLLITLGAYRQLPGLNNVSRLNSYGYGLGYGLIGFGVMGIIFRFPVDFTTDGLADFLGLETLNHGTSWSNAMMIRAWGADPSQGGCDGGATVGHEVAGTGDERQKDYQRHSKGKFFAYMDDCRRGEKTAFLSPRNWNLEKERFEGEALNLHDENNWEEREVDFRWYDKYYYKVIHVPIAVRTYAFGSGAGCAAPRNSTGMIIRIYRFVNGAVNFWITPTVKFYFSPEEIGGKLNYGSFYHDYALPGRALYTTKSISTEYIGISGIYKQASVGNILGRMKMHPGKTIRGAIRLANPLGICLLTAFGIYCLSKK